MLVLNDLPRFLATIRNTLVEHIRPELRSPNLKAETDAIVSLLDRLTLSLTMGDKIAGQRQGEWEAISEGFRHLSLGPLEDFNSMEPSLQSPADALRSKIRALTQSLRTRDAVDLLAKKLEDRETGAMQWFSRAVSALEDLAEASEPNRPRVSGLPTAATPEDEDELQRKLATYLCSRYPELPADNILSFCVSPGGNVKQTVIFSVVPNDMLPTYLVLRRDLAHSITGTSVVDEFPVMSQAFGIGLPVPQPILVETDESILNGKFMIMTEVRDARPAGTYFPEERRAAPRHMGPDFGKEVASVLARLHTATAVSGGAASTEHDRSLRQLHAEWRVQPAQPFALAADLAYAWLFSHPLPAIRPQCLTHGDIGAHNMMVRDGHLAALLDWELARLADPAEDLAQCRMMLLPDVMPWDEFVTEYIAAGGDPRACEPSAVAYYCVQTYIRHGSMHTALRKLYLKGKRDDILAATIAGHYYYRLVAQYQARALRIALEADNRPVVSNG